MLREGDKKMYKKDQGRTYSRRNKKGIKRDFVEFKPTSYDNGDRVWSFHIKPKINKNK